MTQVVDRVSVFDHLIKIKIFKDYKDTIDKLLITDYLSHV